MSKEVVLGGENLNGLKRTLEVQIDKDKCRLLIVGLGLDISDMVFYKKDNPEMYAALILLQEAMLKEGGKIK